MNDFHDGPWPHDPPAPTIGYEIIPPALDMNQEELDRLKRAYSEAESERQRLKRRVMHQRRELRSLNKHVRYWSAVAKSKAVIQAVPTIEVVYANEPNGRPSMVPGLLAVAAVVVLAVTLLLFSVGVKELP